MGDSTITIVGIFLAATLMFVFPLMTMADKTDSVSTLSIQTATTEFTDKIRTTGIITQADYDNLQLTLAATGNSYETELTVQTLDENPQKKIAGDAQVIGDNVYYTLYTTQVLDSLPLLLKEGDIVSVNVKNTNMSPAAIMRNAIYKVTGNNSSTITAQSSGIVTKAAN